ncbi:hypothetical protein Tco_1217095 [Tanacetum coccineum]
MRLFKAGRDYLLGWKDVEMPAFYNTQGRKKSKTSETTSGSASGGFNLNEEVDEAVEETQDPNHERDEQQQTYIELKNRELSIREAEAREAALLKREKLEIQCRTLELTEKEKRRLLSHVRGLKFESFQVGLPSWWESLRFCPIDASIRGWQGIPSGLPRKGTTSKFLACLYVSLNKKKTALRVIRDFIPFYPAIVYPTTLNINYFRHFLDILRNYDLIDDEPMWAADRVVAQTLGSAVTIPKTANEFSIKGNHLTLVKGNQFDGRTKTDPHKHIHEFLGICDMFKYRDTENKVVHLIMFPLSLTGEAKTWLDELNEGIIKTWDELRTAFSPSSF